jgi:hypothetical protein
MSDHIGRIKKADHAGAAAKTAPKAETKAAQSRLESKQAEHGHHTPGHSKEKVDIDHGHGTLKLPNLGAWGDRSHDHNQIHVEDKSNDHNQIHVEDKSNDHNQIDGPRSLPHKPSKPEWKDPGFAPTKPGHTEWNDDPGFTPPHKPDKPRWENPGFFPSKPEKPAWNDDPGFTPQKPEKPTWVDPGFAPKNPDIPGWNNDPGFTPPHKPAKPGIPVGKEPGLVPDRPKWENPGRDGSPNDIGKFDLE